MMGNICCLSILVAPLAGAWIETVFRTPTLLILLSLPLRERGLKHTMDSKNKGGKEVAPLAGAWIETYCKHRLEKEEKVAPLAGAWIETRTWAKQ